MKHEPETLLDVVDELGYTIDLLYCVQTCMEVEDPPKDEVAMSLMLIWNRLCELRDSTQKFVSSKSRNG